MILYMFEPTTKLMEDQLQIGLTELSALSKRFDIDKILEAKIFLNRIGISELVKILEEYAREHGCLIFIKPSELDKPHIDGLVFEINGELLWEIVTYHDALAEAPCFCYMKVTFPRTINEYIPALREVLKAHEDPSFHQIILKIFSEKEIEYIRELTKLG